MQNINLKYLLIMLVTFLQWSLLATENNDLTIDMVQLEEFYQEQLEQNTHWESPQKQEDIRTRRLREWHEQQQIQPVSLQATDSVHNKPPELEADDLFAAATNGNTAKIGRLLAQGLDINTPNSERETALHMAAARGHYSTVIYLINHGAYANAQTVKSWIPLHHAVRFRHHNIVNYLVKHGSSPSVRTSDGKSAIDMAKGINDYRLLSILGVR